MQNYTIKFSDVIQGSGCKNWEFIWETPDCGDIVCNYGNKTFLISVPDGCEGKCFYGIAKCLDDCPGCDDQEIKICPCTVNSDCRACETCSSLNLCISNCPAGEFCTKCEKCGTCDEDHPAPAGKVCNDCNISCPPDKPYDVNGKCKNCRDKWDCPPGWVCGPDGCEPGKCDSGYFHPSKKECVECVNQDHCTAPNTCCINDKCDCCPGFEKNANGDCVKVECKTDEDCSDCETCDIPLGKCKPVVCPPGEFCYGEYGCVPICDCSNPNCPPGHACHNIGNGICLCLPCNGDCSQPGGCKPWCFCDPKTNDCKVNPCKNNCGQGCDPGCSCGDDGETCIPCDDPWCGCDVVSCSNGFECGENCGCDKNGVCRKCEDLTCEECGTVDGCQCSDGVNCQAKKDCKDEFGFEKIDASCDLKVNATVNGGCACSPITIVASPIGGSDIGTAYSLSFKVELRKGIGNAANYVALPKLGDTSAQNIAFNEKPIAGTVSVKVLTYHNIYDQNGNLISPMEFYGATTNQVSFNGEDTMIVAGITVPKIGSTTTGYNKVCFVKIQVEQASQFTFPNNCKYTDVKPIGSYQIDDNRVAISLTIPSGLTSIVPIVNYITSLDKRYPLVSIKKTNSAGVFDSAPFRKVYMIPGSGDGEFYDIIYGPEAFDTENAQPLAEPKGLLWSGRSYLLEADCLCKSPIDTGKLVFCNPNELFFDVVPNTCQRKVELKAPFIPCHVNQDLTQYGFSNSSDFQVKYLFYINDQLVAIFRHDKVKGMIDEATGLSMFRAFEAIDKDFIRNVKIKINHDSSEECTLSYDLPPVSLNIADINPIIDCLNGSDIYKATFNKNLSSGFVINTITAPGVVTISSSGSEIVIGNLMKGVSTTLTINFLNGCSIEFPIQDNCCAESNVSITSSGDLCSGASGTLEAVITGFASGVTYNWKKGVSSVGTGPTLTVNSAGTYTVTVRDSKGCEKTASVSVGEGLSPEFSITPEIICGSGSTVVSVRGLVGANIQISTPSGITNAVITDPSGVYNLTVNSAQPGEYSLISYNSGACNYNPGLSKTLQVVSSSAASFASVSGGCTGDSIVVEITGGIPGETITLTSVGGVFAGTGSSTKVVTLDSNGYASTTVSYSGAGTKTVEGVSSFGSCSNQMTPVTFSIAQDPQITSVSHICDNPAPTSNVQLSAVISGVTGLSTVQVKNASTNALLGSFTLTSGVWTSTLFAPPTNRQVKIVATNGSCTSEFSYTIPACNCPNYFVTLNNDPNIVLCNGGFETLSLLDVSPAGTYTYQWFKDGTPIVGETGTSLVVDMPGVYHLQIQDGDCTGESDPVTVSIVNAPVLTLNNPVPYSAPANHCNGTLSFSLSTSGAYSGLKWYLDSVLQPSFNNLLNASFSFPAAGSHTVKVVAEYGIGCTEEVEYNFSIVICCENCMYSIEAQDELTSSASTITSFEVANDTVRARLKGVVTKTCSVTGVSTIAGTVISEPYTSFDILAVRASGEEILTLDILNGGLPQVYNVPAGPSRTNMGILANDLNTLLGTTTFHADGNNLSQYVKAANGGDGFDVSGGFTTSVGSKVYTPSSSGNINGRVRYVAPCKTIEYAKVYQEAPRTIGFTVGDDIQISHNSITINGSLSASPLNNTTGHDPSTPSPGCTECS